MGLIPFDTHMRRLHIWYARANTIKNMARRGFTLPEMLLSVTLLVMIGGMVMPMYRTFLVRDDLDIAATTLSPP